MSEYQTNKQWKKWYDSYQEFSGSKVKYCKTHKLNYHQFLYWCNKLGKKMPKLIPVDISAKDEALASIRLKGGHILEITSLAALKLLLSNFL
tara:strand:- start:2086 stop:2361 length:276 start_codon:yes stop_codon:yes gene_type:complete